MDKKKINIYNLPNLLSLIRIIASPLLVLLVFHGMGIWPMAILFAIAAFTDFLDGFIARRFNMVTNLGRKLDMIADRILVLSLVIAIFLYGIKNNLVDNEKSVLILVILSREILCAPLFVISFLLKKRPQPHARFAGKLMTCLQGVAFPFIILGWPFAAQLAIITCLVGIVSAIYYLYDSLINPNNKFQKDMDKYYSKL